MKYLLALLIIGIGFLAIGFVFFVHPTESQNLIGKALVQIDSIGKNQKENCKSVAYQSSLYKPCK